LVKHIIQDYVNNIALLINGTEAEYLTAFYYTIENTGSAPIVLTDYVKPVSVSVDPPWELLAVDSDPTDPYIKDVHWTRVSSTTFEMQPSLLNPGDKSWTVILVKEPNQRPLENKGPELHWNARITNIRQLNFESAEEFQYKLLDAVFYLNRNYVGIAFIVSIIAVLVVVSVQIGNYISNHRAKSRTPQRYVFDALEIRSILLESASVEDVKKKIQERYGVVFLPANESLNDSDKVEAKPQANYKQIKGKKT
jgi:hypothetical protein